jgi:hypothetical protein
MKRFSTVFVALGLATAGSTALAEQTKDQLGQQNTKPQPVQMTDAQLDSVAAGQRVNISESLVTVQGVDVEVRLLNNSANNNTVQVPVQAAVGAAVGVLGNAGALAGTFGRQVQQ